MLSDNKENNTFEKVQYNEVHGDLFGRHTITKTRLCKYMENFTTKKNENSQIKKSNIFHISAQNIDCGYALEPPRRGGSNEYPQSMFLSRSKKILYTL